LDPPLIPKESLFLPNAAPQGQNRRIKRTSEFFFGCVAGAKHFDAVARLVLFWDDLEARMWRRPSPHTIPCGKLQMREDRQGVTFHELRAASDVGC
jgi:hypothetical protein